ncbi:MAG: hypothetical protein JWP37_4034 [Mucilaginibacter sp.]|nr:hypothetical protein [Mucilaginibacter sp.]
MKRIFLLALIFIGFLGCRSKNQNTIVWTEAYEAKVYKTMDNFAKLRMRDNQKRNLFVSYLVKRLKAVLPNGINSVSVDSLRKLAIKIGADYSYAHPNGLGPVTPKATAWTPDLERTFRIALVRLLQIEHLDKDNKICDCVITNLKKTCPDSVILPMPNNVLVKIATDCGNSGR